MKIAVISDLHIGDEARSEDFRPESYSTSTCIDKCYKDDFISFVHKKGITADYLIITGDITNQATLCEFELAKNIIPDLASSMNIPEDHVICIPGNHDVDWKIMDGVTGRDLELRKALRYNTFLSGFATDNANLLELVKDPFYTIWDFEDLLIIGINSAFHDTKDSKIHNGLASDSVIKSIEDKLCQLSQPITKPKIFIVHHHPYQYSTGSDEPDVSIMHNAEELIKMLSKNQIDMIIHGHKHVPNITSHSFNGLHPVTVLCAGSFSVLLEQKLNGTILNTFHVITFEEKGESPYVKGYIENYSYAYPHKWSECKKINSRLVSKQGFGEYGDIHIWKTKLLPVIDQKIKENNVVEWHSLHEDFPELEYCHPDAIEHLSTKIADELELKNFDSVSGRVLYKSVLL